MVWLVVGCWDVALEAKKAAMSSSVMRASSLARLEEEEDDMVISGDGECLSLIRRRERILEECRQECIEGGKD